MNIAFENGSRRATAMRSYAVFSALKRDIMLGDLAPARTLTELELAARFGCSQGTVREALLQLQDEGLVVRQGHRGTVVSACTQDEAVELFRIRRSIEARGIRRAVAGRSKTLVADLSSLAGAMEQAAVAGDELELASLDRDFHRRLFADAELPALDPILHRCLVHNHRFKISQSAASERDLVQTARRHAPIVAAVDSGDEEAAARALDHHIVTIVDFGPAVFPEVEA